MAKSRVFVRVETYTPDAKMMKIARDRTRDILEKAVNRDVKLSVLAASCYAQGIEDAAVSLAMRGNGAEVGIVESLTPGELLEPHAEMC